MQMRTLVLSLLFFSSCTRTDTKEKGAVANSTETISLEEGNSCTYSGSLEIKSAYPFKSDNEAEAALKSIMSHTGLPTNFLLVASDVDNAAAAIYKNQRYILYNQRFLEDVTSRTKSNFGALSILAHEVGHHLSGHTLIEADARANLELEADRFSGFVLAKMGATLSEACIAMELYGSNTASLTHPAKRTRLAAITNGWKEAMEDNKNNSVKEIAAPSTSHRTYVIDVFGEAKFITIRNRSLNPDEYRLGNSGTKAGENLNRETVVMKLPNGTKLEVLSSINCTYYVKAKTPKGDILGYIVKTFAGQPTIKALAKR